MIVAQIESVPTIFFARRFVGTVLTVQKMKCRDGTPKNRHKLRPSPTDSHQEEGGD